MEGKSRMIGWGGRDSRAWTPFVLAGLAWSAGTALWALHGGVPREPAGVALFISALLCGVGIALFPGTPPHASGKARTAVDGMIVAWSALFVAWVLGFGGLYGSTAGADRLLIVTAAMSYVSVAAAAIVILTRARPVARPALARLALGLSALAVATAAMAYLTLGGAFEAAPALYAGWAIGWALLALAVRRSLREMPERELEPGLPTRASVFVPSVPFAVGVLAAALAGVRGDFDSALIWIGAAVIVLIVMRQVLALWENISFWRNLEAKIEARTDDLRRSESRFRSLVQNASDAIMVIGGDGSVRYLSPSVHATFGHPDSAFNDGPRLDLVAPEDVERVLAIGRGVTRTAGATASFECRVRRADGELRDIEATARNLLDDPAVEGFVINARDITERKQLERQLTHRAFHDPLTELANRALFGDRLEHALGRRRQAPDSVAVLFLDLDDFKTVNDSLGHEAGDQLLGAVSKRLLGCARPGDTVARLGGDEFAILLEDVDGAIGSARVAARVLAAFEEPLQVGDRDLFVQASIGIATNAEPTQTAERLLGNADVAMYAAKARGKGRFEHFEHNMHAALVERLELEQDLRDAIGRNEFVLHFQPVVSLRSGEVQAVETLVRWQHPERGLIAPGYFISLAEQTGLIVPIGRWILNAACTQLADWRDQIGSRGSLTMMVNLSVKQLQDPGFVSELEEALEQSDIDPGLLLLEITESMIVENEATIATMKEIRGLGVRIGVDDFGTKYSSLSYLRRLPIDVLKVDREFMQGLGTDAAESALMQAIIAMSHAMNLTPIAEGVETRQQEEELKRMGCNLAQGFLFGRPAPAEQIVELVADSVGETLIERR